MTPPATWTLVVPAPAEFLTANFRGDKWAKARLVKTWRDTTYMLALAAKPKLPKGLGRVRIDAQLRLGTHRDRDMANWVDAAKASVDALGPWFRRGGKRPAFAPGYELIPDDSPKHLDGPHVRFGPDVPAGQREQLVLVITDLTALAPGRTWTPDLVSAAGDWIGRAKRQCNGCSHLLGDVTEAEIAAAMMGRTLPDVRSECPTCTGHLDRCGGNDAGG